MDISSYISELLFEHDCVIIPNFGGFICNYKPADIHPVLNTISPPSKAISFNKNLQSNDGLLVNYISNAQNISFDAALDIVSSWVYSSKHLLKKSEVLWLKKIGKFSNDIEGNLQFAPFDEVNYLKASFGLKTITAEPILRGKQIDFTEKFIQETKHPVSTRRVWSIAASVLLVVCLVALAELMWMGAEIKPLHVDEAGICSLFTHIFKAPEPEIKPVPIEVETKITVTPPVVQQTETVVDSSALATAEVVNDNATVINNAGAKADTYIPPASVAGEHTYYVIVGAFMEEGNIAAAKQRLQQKYPDSVILVEKGNRLTRLGYSVGSNFYRAKTELATAQAEDANYWLMKK